MEQEEFNLEKLKLETNRIWLDFLIKFGFLICAVFFVISSQTNLLTDKGSITNTYKITCGQNRCVIYNPKNGAYKPVIWDYMNAVKWSHQIGDKASF